MKSVSLVVGSMFGAVILALAVSMVGALVISVGHVVYPLPDPIYIGHIDLVYMVGYSMVLAGSVAMLIAAPLYGALTVHSGRRNALLPYALSSLPLNLLRVTFLLNIAGLMAYAVLKIMLNVAGSGVLLQFVIFLNLILLAQALVTLPVALQRKQN